VRPPSDFTLMLYSIETYRGHTKGFEFNFLEAIGIGFIIAALLEKRSDFRWFPPVWGSWVLWVMASLISVVTALEPLYAFMPAFKRLNVGFIFNGVFVSVLAM